MRRSTFSEETEMMTYKTRENAATELREQLILIIVLAVAIALRALFTQ